MSVSAHRRVTLVCRSAWGSVESGSRAPFGRGRETTAGASRKPNAARTSSQLRNAFAGSWRGLEGTSGIARSREPVFYANLYGGGRGAPSRRLSPRPPPCVNRDPGSGRGPADSGVTAEPRPVLAITGAVNRILNNRFGLKSCADRQDKLTSKWMRSVSPKSALDSLPD